MQKKLRWYQHFGINSYWFGLNIASGVITPLLLPYLVVQFMPTDYKNTYLATLRVVGLAVAMLVQPLAGMLSDRNTSRWGRRRPFILVGTILNVLFLAIIAASPSFKGSALDPFFENTLGVTAAYAVLLVGLVLLQVSSNTSQGAIQGLIPDLVPAEQRGFSSGTKSVLELLPVFLVLFIGPLIDKGLIWLVILIIMLVFVLTMFTTMIWAREKPYTEKSGESLREPFLRLLGLTILFVAVTRVAVWLVSFSGSLVQASSITTLIVVVGLAGLIGMAGSIFIGVYLGAWVGIGKEARQQRSFIWWVINRLLFLAAVGSVQGFAQFYLRDVLKVANPASMTTYLMATVALFLIPSALGGGALADRIGRRKLISASGLVAAFGMLVLLFANGMPLVIVAGCLIGLAAGTFMATNWAMGTDLVPAKDAGKYLGISNLAGAGAGIVGAGIGGPMADYFNLLQPGLGYTVIFAIYGVLFLLSILALTRVKTEPVETVALEHAQA